MSPYTNTLDFAKLMFPGEDFSKCATLLDLHTAMIHQISEVRKDAKAGYVVSVQFKHDPQIRVLMGPMNFSEATDLKKEIRERPSMEILDATFSAEDLEIEVLHLTRREW